MLLAHFVQRGVPQAGPELGLALNILGHLGVELFFVLSGFLIGGLLIDICERSASLRDWRIFMARRMMRTVPAYMLCVLLLLAVKPFAQVQAYLPQYLTFTQNLAWPMPPTQWFAVSWSLAVEEWFYLLFSVVLLCCSALAPRKGFWVAISVFLLLPLGARLAFAGHGDWDATLRKVVLLRLDAIGYGVLLAKIMRTSKLLETRWGLSMLAGIVLLGASLTYWQMAIATWGGGSVWWQVLSFNAVSIGLALLFPAALRISIHPGLTASVIAAGSTLSYGMYLYHSMMLDWARSLLKAGGLGAAAGLVLAGIGTVAAAWLSYRYFERPILALRPEHAGQKQGRPKDAALDSRPLAV